MTRKLFGTDGVRGRANSAPMTADTALKLGAAAGRYFRRDGSSAHRVVIGKDTRLSGYMFENALTAGFASTGMNVFLLGPVPTPAVGMITTSMRADVGVMISASHNPHQDNGIKFFGPDGYKLSDEAEAEIEAMVLRGVEPVAAENIGRTTRIDDSRFRYNERIKATLPTGQSLSGLKIVIDCANGAAYRTAPEALWELGTEVIPVGVSPDGTNINLGCGSTDTRVASETVISSGADVGICLDGDADRVMIIDETGAVAGGDQIMALLASRWSQAGRLAHNTLVATVMSNLGLERYLGAQGITLERTAVGDRYVVEHMRAGGFNLGGEQSGHIVMTDYATTGDGLMASLQFLSAMVETNARASELTNSFENVPQKLENFEFDTTKDPLAADSVQKAITAAEARIGQTGRLLIRKSGTEPLIRVMAECEDQTVLNEVIEGISSEIRAVLG